MTAFFSSFPNRARIFQFVCLFQERADKGVNLELAQLKQKNREEARESLATSIVLRRTRRDAVLLANNYIQHLTALEQLVFRHMWSTLLLLAIYSLLVLNILTL